MERIKMDDIVQWMAQIKQYMMYGAQIAYPFITAFTAVGVAKVAFDIPPAVAFGCLLCVVLGIGITSFKIGLYSKDYEIQWVNTPSAKDLCDRVKKIERIIDEKH
jgi:hypothetical protein